MYDNTNIFTLTVSCTEIKLNIDSTQLNFLTSALSTSENFQLLKDIEKSLKDTYEDIIPIMRELLTSINPDIGESRIHSMSESTIFYNKEETDYA